MRDRSEYFKNIEKLIEKNPEQARKNARKVALKHFSMEKKVIEEYIPLYNKVLK